MRTTNRIPRPIKRLPVALAAFAAGAALAASGCGSKREHAQIVSEKTYLAAENRRVSDALEARNAEMKELEVALLEVRNGLDGIRREELDAVRSSLRVAGEGRASQTLREELRAEVSTIRDAVRANLAKLARLEDRSRESGLRIASLEKATAELRRSLEEKDALAGVLDQRIRELSATVKTQAASLKEKDTAIRENEVRLARMTQEANAAAR